MENTEKKEEKRPDRSVKKRIPVSQQGNRLSTDGLDFDKYHYYTFNHIGNRVELALAGGYEYVDAKELNETMAGRPTKLGKHVSIPVGGDMRGFLMRIPKELWEEDQKIDQKKVDEEEKKMKPDFSKGFYGPGVENK